MPGARHTSCTVEMASCSEEYEVAVIDEIQVVPRLPPLPQHASRCLCGCQMLLLAARDHAWQRKVMI